MVSSNATAARRQKDGNMIIEQQMAKNIAR